MFEYTAVINLKKRKERLKDTLNQLDFPVTVIEAIDGDKLSHTTIEPRVKACIRSHKKAIRAFYDKPYVTIFEDDVLLTPQFKDWKNKIQELPKDWQLFFWGTMPIQSEPIGDNLSRFTKTVGTWAYTIKKELYNKVLAFHENEPFDVQLQQCMEHCYGFTDGIIGVRKGWSDIKQMIYDPQNFYIKDNVEYE
jgi:GR25 family glycosyltransferase involved in LPS biosynthesis